MEINFETRVEPVGNTVSLVGHSVASTKQLLPIQVLLYGIRRTLGTNLLSSVR
jgi:hypothetical protein